MDLTEKATELGEKYHVSHSETYDLMLYIDVRMLLNHPIKSMFESPKKKYEKVCALTERYLSRRNYKQSKGIPVGELEVAYLD